VFVKFGRRGRPHRRFVWLPPGETALCWRTMGIGEAGRDPGRLPLQSSCRVVRGPHTAVFRRQLDVVGAQGGSCVSVSGASRSLDLLAASPEQRDRWAAALEAVIAAL